MKLENPWITAACSQHAVRPNDLETFLQEQYGQLGEDLILEAILKSLMARAGRPPASLRYLEVGANHPIQTSNTFLFYRKWRSRGVLVEANPRLIDALNRVRPQDCILNLAVAPRSHGPEVELFVAKQSELSSLDAGHVASFGDKGLVADRILVSATSLDALLEAHFRCGLDLLSMDIEGLDLQVLREATMTVRPTCIVAEPSRHYQADSEQQFAAALEAKGYIEIARTDYNLVYVDRAAIPSWSPTLPATRHVLTTFDIFDTLIARRCIHPHAVFDDVEIKRNVPGFAAARVKAEQSLEQNDYSIVDIYRELKRDLALSEDAADALLEAELQEELANVVPIADNIARLTPDSVLITDMYLPPDVIRAMLSSAGVSDELPIVQTSHGKRTGTVWRTLANAGYVCRHLGDNPQSDHDSALAAGMQPEIQSLGTPSSIEATLLDVGLVELPRSLRAARLMTPTAGVAVDVHRLQLEFNVPLLAVCSILIRHHAMTQGLDRVVYAARDGLHLKLMHDSMDAAMGGCTATHYWHTSRIARTSGDAQYLEYCRSLIGATSLVVDLCGTGASLARLYQDLGLAAGGPQTLLCQKLDNAALAQEFADNYGLDQDAALHVFNIVDGSFCPNEDLEILNYVPHGMTTAVRRLGSEWLPIRAPYEFDDRLQAVVASQHSLVISAVRHLAQVLTHGAIEEVIARGPEIVEAIRASAQRLEPQRSRLRELFLPAHRAFEAKTRATLKRVKTFRA